ncbi:sodium:calcium antiporter (plasmid) [Haloferax mediterranei ATCC 33500]|uniref:Na+/Ca2+-antiporter-like protein n=1 Tax=Haloferax mediterranei (strain ATCC 33500 / DSM 1411 / JCM 8866 / NBRC 14739 / NCIMB 2177 / R-4) TaxID=523841 RepID=I3RA77_HALMT|nr:sodium:calcium antiporter [Haloferax mediterranei]AFK21137.1 Na+/Ca2+-antiporter-like protein [Haloferax mediterranei ATCC 33500]AHZ24338.1 Na+/Ca2+-antiporter-like protein [Haloferax mediterranei ATCC 33500]ELZ97073.1 Na+/Ca2+-antiporter-like protein [Haloferax mediterranei ATCC 33500]MDX5990180.1 sodium:calcium antiporter [Haloferax mediterranei ATCC 33500]QCQ76746.1 sodium:calcium antiporter [Haloferax mediterranei ATCC 33500]
MAVSSPVLAVGAFIVGVVIIVYSVEELVENITKAAVVTGLSTFVLAVLFAGLDFENWAFGVASMLGELPGIAIGSALGSGLFLVGVAVAIGGFIAPFETTVDRDYLALLFLSPLLLLVFILDGMLSRFDGVALLAFFGLILGYIYCEEEKGRETFRDEEAEKAVSEVESEGHGEWYYLGLSVLFVVGIVVGSELAVRGARGIVTAFGLNQTVFGMTFVGMAMAVEEVTLVVAPVREGRPSIAVGNIVGSLIFFATGNIGLLAVTRAFTLDPSVLAFYWPVFFIATAATGFFLYRGRIKRPEAIVLGALYVAYWIGSYLTI